MLTILYQISYSYVIQWKKYKFMKKFQFPQIFKPIVGDISFEINSHYHFSNLDPLTTNRYLSTYRDLKLASSNQNSKTSTLRHLSTTKNLSIVADSMIQENRQQRTNKQKILDYLSQINKKCSQKSKQPIKQRTNKVKFDDMMPSSNTLILQSQNKVPNKFKSRRIMTEQSKQNIRIQNETKKGEEQIKSKVKRRQAIMRTSIEQNKNFVEEIIKFSQQKKMKTSSKQKRKLSDKGLFSKRITRRNSKVSYPLDEELDRLNIQCQQIQKSRLEISSRGTNQNSLLSAESCQTIKKNNEEHASGESELMSILTQELDRQYSDTDLDKQKFSVRKMKRNNSILQSYKRKRDTKKSLLRKINTMHFLATYSDEEQQQQTESETKIYNDKSRHRIKFLEFLVQGNKKEDHPPVIIPKTRKLTKKVTFFEKSHNESQQSLSDDKSQKPSIQRAKQKRKCIIRLRNYKTSLETSNNLIPQFSESENMKQRKYMLPNFQKKWTLQRTNSSQLIPLDTNVYNELNNFFTRIYQNNQNKAQEEIPTVIQSSQPIHMTVSNKQAQFEKERLGNLRQEHKMIDLGVRLTKGKKLLQKPV